MSIGASISQIPLFQGLALEQLELIANAGHLRTLEAGNILFHQGDPADQFYILLSGHLKVSQITPSGEQVVVRILQSGQLCGIAKALGRQDYPGTALAIDQAIIAAWPMAFWDQLISVAPQLAQATIRTVGERLDEAHTKFSEIATQDVEQRVARALLRLAQSAGVAEVGTIRLDFPITRQDLAEMTGTTLHSVSRLIAAWEANGWVKGGRKKLTILSPEALMHVADKQKD